MQYKTKPLVQKLPLEEGTSFVAKTFRTPNFEVGWHQHIEYELIYFTEGQGLGFVGNHVSAFETGDVYFLGANLPHTFQKTEGVTTAAVVVQFREDFWGSTFLQIPENTVLLQALKTSAHGLKMNVESKRLLAPLIRKLEHAKGLERLFILMQCLQIIAERKEHTFLSTQNMATDNVKDKECIDRVFQFTIDHFREDISLSKIAGVACLSIPAFCNYFKRRTQKTYVDFLNEVRVGYACSQLTETELSVTDIGYTSGFNTVPHFHRQFLKLKKMTPLQYRKQFEAENISKGKLIGIEA